MREFGYRTPDTPAARKKNRIGGGILTVALVLMLVANLIGAYGGPRTIIGPLLYAGGALLFAGIIYMLMSRKES